MPGVARSLEARVARDRAREAVGRGALLHVRRPGDAVLVEEVGEVGPAVERPVGIAPQRRGSARSSCRDCRAGARLVRVAALRRPAGDEPEVRRQAPAPVRLEHVVLEDEVPRVGPVVRDLRAVVVAHDVRAAEVRAGRAVPMAAAVADERAVGDADEAVHPAAVDVLLAGERAVRAAGVVRAARVEERRARTGRRRSARRPSARRSSSGSRRRAGSVPKKESKERFSSMITTTWQILWIPCGGDARVMSTARDRRSRSSRPSSEDG